jgi:hypothetical protein
MGEGAAKCNRVVAAVIVSLNAALAGPTLAAELTPYSLPSQQRPVIPDARQQAAPPPSRSTVDDTYYEKFASDAATLSPRQRTDLEKSFSQSRDKALKAGRVDEAQHYLRLISILQAQH